MRPVADLGRLMVGQIPSLRRYAWALVADRTRADDLVQDCLERAWSRSHLFRGQEDIRVWLFTILQNLYVSSLRRQSRQPVLTPLTDQVGGPSVRAVQEIRVEIADLDSALGGLPADQRAAVLLVGAEGMTYREAATVLAIPVGTLMSRLHRGRKQLRALMADTPPAHLRRVK